MEKGLTEEMKNGYQNYFKITCGGTSTSVDHYINENSGTTSEKLVLASVYVFMIYRRNIKEAGWRSSHLNIF
jgi:hypothetical protein